MDWTVSLMAVNGRWPAAVPFRLEVDRFDAIDRLWEGVFKRKSKKIEEIQWKFEEILKENEIGSFGYMKNEKKKKMIMKRCFKRENGAQMALICGANLEKNARLTAKRNKFKREAIGPT